MATTRRDFLKYCSASSVALGLTAAGLAELGEALANPNAPKVLWLQGSSCTGCTVSFLNRMSSTAPYTAKDVLIDTINLAFHANLMATAGEGAVAALDTAYTNGGYILAIEGGVPTAFGGAACFAYSRAGKDVTFQDVVRNLATRASKIISVGACAAFGGIPASGGNPTGVQSVRTNTGKTTINIAGCPPHPDWIVWTIAQLVANKTIALDSYGRPTALYGGEPFHKVCPRKGTGEADRLGIDRKCLKKFGCKGPVTRSLCPSIRWNSGVNWCVDANAPCLGCTNPSFPGSGSFYREG